MHLTTDPRNPMAPQFVDHGLSTVNALNKGARIWIPATRIIRLLDVTHWRAVYHYVGGIKAIGDAVEENHTIVNKTIKPILKFGWKIPNFNLSAKTLKGFDHLWNRFMLM